MNKMKLRSTFNNNKIYSKGARSMERIKPSKKLNLSIMDEKLSILNSDIEELYKKYVEKKKLRRRKEKSEQSLASRINFLIDEERKIRNQIENNLSKNHRCSKNWSVKMLRAPEIINQYSMRYNTIESNDESPRHVKLRLNNSKKGNIKARYIDNLNKIEKIYESDTKNKQFEEMIKKNGMNDITLSSIQNNSSIENNNNIAIGNRSNVTNNVCIIINSSDKSNSKNEIKSIQDISFAEKESDINDNFKDNGTNEKENNNSKIYFQESENKNRINNEINYIKMRLASKINEDNMQSISHTYEQNNEITLGSQNKSNLYVNEMTAKKNNYKEYLNENLEDNLKTPSFKQKIKADNKGKRSKFIRDELNIKQKNLRNFDKYDNLEKKQQYKKINIRERKETLDNRKNKKFNIETNPNNIKDKKIEKRCFSKPDNGIKKNKVYNTFNHNNINNKNVNGNKSQIINKIINIKSKINKDNGIKKDDDYDKLSIDSDEIILSDKLTNISQPFKQKVLVKKNINKSINSLIEEKNTNSINKNEQKEEKIYYICDSTPNLFQNINLTFNQSIEKKRQLLGIPSNVKENLNSKMEEISKIDNKIKEKETDNLKKNDIKEDKNTYKDKNNGAVIWERNTPNNKSTRTIYDKRYINKKINVKPKNKNEINLNNINSPYKETRYDNESYPSTYNNYSTNNIVYTQLFKNSNYKKNNFEDKDKKNTNIASTSSLTSLFSIQSNKSNKVNNTLFKNKNKGNEYIIKSNNNISHIAKIKNTDVSKSNNNIIIKKNDNKNYLNTIRLIKKRDKNNNNNKESQINKIEEKKEVYNYLNTKNNKKDDNPKFYENEIQPRKELAVIRRINKKIENYKKNGPQVYQISKKHNNRFEANNRLNYYKGNNYQFHSFRRLSELQKRSKSNNSYRKTGVSKSKSNRSLNRSIQKGNKSFKHFKF